jgi:hypothetical protein
MWMKYNIVALLIHRLPPSNVIIYKKTGSYNQNMQHFTTGEMSGHLSAKEPAKKHNKTTNV